MVLEEKANTTFDLAIVIPTLNEESGIEATITSIKDAIKSKFSYTFVIVDGASKDRTVEIAKSMGARVIMQRRRGQRGITALSPPHPCASAPLHYLLNGCTNE